MYKTVRSLALALLLTVAVVPASRADRWGGAPVPTSPTFDGDTAQDAILFNLGLL